VTTQLCQSGGENPNCSREAVGFIGGAHWCQLHYDRIAKMFEDTRQQLARLANIPGKTD
jgi:hypothetical protein